MSELLPQTVRPHRVWPALLAIAAVVTFVNALKPLAIDDAINAEYAKQIALHPTDPYGFQVFWTQWPEPANWMLVPPVMPYWWAIAIRFFGPSVLVWKLWLFPWIAAFVFSVHALLRRLSPQVALPLTLFVVFEPVTFPAINYMLDLPALGLGLFGLCLSMRAIDRKSAALAGTAGVLFGLAMQTKYNMATLPAAAAIYGLTRRDFWRGVLPGLVALALFVGIEVLFARRYGSSHFLWTFRGRDLFDGRDKLRYLLFAAVPLVGGIGGPLALLMLFQLGVARRWLLAGAMIVIAAFALTAAAPVGLPTFTVLGIAVWIVFVITIVPFIRRTSAAQARADEVFLLGWLAIELVGFVVISPTGATRRLFVILLVLMLITARLLHGRVFGVAEVRTLRRLTAFAAALGFAFFAVDCLDAGAMRSGAESAAAVIARYRRAGQHVYFKGHWGFQFYCENAGMQPVVPDQTVLHAGDWFVYPTSAINMQSAVIPLDSVQQVASFTIDDPLKLETEPAFYGAYVPMDHRSAPRFSVTVYQATASFVPVTNMSPGRILLWALTRPRPMLPDAVPAVMAAMKHTNAAEQKAVAAVIVGGGAAALIEASHNPDPVARRWATAQLGKLSPAPAVITELKNKLSDADPGVRAAAAKALRVTDKKPLAK